MTEYEIEKEQVTSLILLRSKLAYSTKGQHSWSFSDDELKSLIKIKPRTLDELGVIKGFPRAGKRVNSYGSLIVDIFNGRNFSDFKVTASDQDLEVEGIIKPLKSFSK